MGSFSIWHWLILIMVVTLLFGGKGKISNLMGDLAHGIRNFKDGLKEPPEDASKPRSIPESNRDTVEVEAKRKDEVHS